MNNIVVIGRLTRDPELRYIQGSGTAVATFTIAVDRDYKNRDGTVTTDFIPVEIMGKGAETVANNLTKGRLVAVPGSLRIEQYEKDGQKRSFAKISARYAEFLDYAKTGEKPAQTQAQTKQVDYAAVANNFSAIEDDDVPF